MKSVAIFVAIIVLLQYGSNSTDTNLESLNELAGQIAQNMGNIGTELQRIQNPDLLALATHFPQNFGEISKFIQLNNNALNAIGDFISAQESKPLPGEEESFLRTVGSKINELTNVNSKHAIISEHVAASNPYTLIQFRNGKIGFPTAWLSNFYSEFKDMSNAFTEFGDLSDQLRQLNDTPGFRSLSEELQRNIQLIFNWIQRLGDLSNNAGKIMATEINVLESIGQLSETSYTYYDVSSFLIPISTMFREVGSQFLGASDATNELTSKLNALS